MNTLCNVHLKLFCSYEGYILLLKLKLGENSKVRWQYYLRVGVNNFQLSTI